MELSNPIVDEQLNSLTEETVQAQETPETKPLTEREYKAAMQKMLQERKEIIKKNKELIADKELQVQYWKAESDLFKYRFEKMDYYLKNLEIEPRYLQAVEEQRIREENQQPKSE